MFYISKKIKSTLLCKVDSDSVGLLFLFYVFEKCDLDHPVMFWKKVRQLTYLLPKIIGVKFLKKHADDLCRFWLKALFMLKIINTEERMNAFYEGCSLINKAYLLNMIEGRKITAKKNNRQGPPYPSFDLIDKDIEKLTRLDYPYKVSALYVDSYRCPDDRLESTFVW